MAEQAVRGLARFHAGFRGDPRLASLYWLPSADVMPRQLQAAFHRSTRRKRQELSEILNDQAWAALAWTQPRLPEIVARLSRAPQTVVHGDYRLD